MFSCASTLSGLAFARTSVTFWRSSFIAAILPALCASRRLTWYAMASLDYYSALVFASSTFRGVTTCGESTCRLLGVCARCYDLRAPRDSAILLASVFQAASSCDQPPHFAAAVAALIEADASSVASLDIPAAARVVARAEAATSPRAHNQHTLLHCKSPASADCHPWRRGRRRSRSARKL